MLLYDHPDPDFSRLNFVLRHQGEPDRVPFIELFADTQVMAAFVEDTIERDDYRIPDPHDRSKMDKALGNSIRFWNGMGYDYMSVHCPPVFQITWQQTQDTAALSKGQRLWASEELGNIGSWKEFEEFPWPKSEDIDYYAMEYVAKHLPEGMKIIFQGPGGQLENMMWLMGIVNFSIKLIEEPELIEVVSIKVGKTLTRIWETVADMDRVGALWLGDDMGFRTNTLISPEHLRRYVFPWQKKLVEISHEHDLPFLLHSCGNLRSIMDELIKDVEIDAIHSFQDLILSAPEAKELYGDQIAILGGVDIDFLCRATEEEVRLYTRNLIDKCAPGGGYALGTGNSVANYIPLKNYRTMLEEGRSYGRY